MIASLSGTVQGVSTSSAVINVGGVGFSVLAAPDTLSRLRVGDEAFVYTSLVVKEDSLTLFGFIDLDEKETFEILQTVSGIGARTALAILAVLPPDALRQAISQKNEAALTRVPGIGKKGAQRMILEIGTKLGPVRGNSAYAASEYAGASASQSAFAAADTDVIDALVNLGWPERLASEALEAARKESGEESLGVPELLRNALRILGSRR